MKTTELALMEKIMYIGNKIPQGIAEDTRPKFVVLGTPQEFIDETMDKSPLNKDFYNDVPSMVCEALDRTFIPKYGKELWFNDAWEEYRQHILTAKMDEMKMPMAIFKKYIP